MIKKMLFIAPHSDDLAFSVGGILNDYRDFLIIDKYFFTIYIKSNHAPYSNIKEVKEITNIRKFEDKEYANYINAEYNNSCLSEGLLRGYKNISELFNVDQNPKKDNTYLSVKKRVHEEIERINPDFIFFPLGLGNHIEHRILNVIGNNYLNSIFYEDLPYAGDYSNTELNTYCSGQLSKGIIKIDLVKKINSLNMFYPSQVGAKELEKVKMFHKNRDRYNSINKLHFYDTEKISENPIYFESLWARRLTLDKLLSVII